MFSINISKINTLQENQISIKYVKKVEKDWSWIVTIVGCRLALFKFKLFKQGLAEQKMSKSWLELVSDSQLNHFYQLD